MSLRQRIDQDIKAAMKARDGVRLSALRMLMAAIRQREIDERIEADDVVVLSVIDRLCKQRRDSIDQFASAGRDDLVQREAAELAVIDGYRPAQLTSDELDAEIEAAIASVPGAPAGGPGAVGRVMAVLKPRLAGRADLGLASSRVRARLVA